MKTLMKIILLIGIGCLLQPFVFAQEEDEFYPTTIGSLKATIRLFGEGNLSNLKEGQKAWLQILTFQETPFQKMNIVKEKLYINGKDFLSEHINDEYGNKYSRFFLYENGDFTYELIVDVERSALIYALEDYIISEKIRGGENFLEPSEKIESDSSEIVTLVKNKFTNNSFFETLNETVSWVNDYVEYAEGDEFYDYYFSQKSALETLMEKKGVCDEFANLGAALLRAKGVPTKIAIGITFDGKKWGNHAWIEVKDSKGNWIPSDPTFRESGFVDATHIKMGSFNDVSLSLAKATYPSNAKLSFSIQKLPEITVTEKSYFDVVEVEVENPDLKTNQWNSIKVKLKNKTNSKVMAPVIIPSRFKEIYIRNPKQGILLEPFGEGELEFLIYPNINLSGKVGIIFLKINTLGEPIEKKLTMAQGAKKESGEVVVEEVTPIVSGEDLIIELNVANYLSEDSEFNLKIMDTNTLIDLNQSTESFLKFETNAQRFSKTHREEIKGFEEKKYDLEISTPTHTYTQSIYPFKLKMEEPEDINTDVEIKQKIKTEKEEGPMKYIASHPEIMMGMIFVALFILFIGLLRLRKLYV